MSHNKNKLPVCANCSYEFTDANNFCPVCGQENHDIRLPIKHHIHEVIEGLLHFDSKSMRTFFYLIIKPGLLSREFNSGKRVRFVPPVRLYIFISFLFFFLISTGKIYKTEKEPKAGNKETAAQIDSVLDKEKENLTPAQIETMGKYKKLAMEADSSGNSKKLIDSLKADKDINNNAFNRFVFKKVAIVEKEGSEHVAKLLQKNFSYGMFLLMPLIGWLIYLFYRKTGSYYIENFIISIHYHCVIFLLFSLVILTDKFLPFSSGYVVVFLIVPAYLFFMLKEYYKEKTSAALAKAFAISFIQMIFTIIFSIAVVFVTISLL